MNAERFKAEVLPTRDKLFRTARRMLEEIAQITGTTNEAVRVNLSRARKKVREEFIRLTGPRK